MSRCQKCKADVISITCWEDARKNQERYLCCGLVAHRWIVANGVVSPDGVFEFRRPA